MSRSFSMPISILAFIVVATSWGTVYLFSERCLDYVDPVTMCAFRCLIGAFVMLVIEIAYSIYDPDNIRRTKLALAKKGALYNCVVFALFFSVAGPILSGIGQLSLSSGVSGVLICLDPLACAFYGHFVNTRQQAKLDLTAGIGLSLGVAGTILSAVPSVSSNSGIFFLISAIISSFCFSAGTIFNEHVHDETPLLARLTIQMLIGGVFDIGLAELCLRLDLFSSFYPDSALPMTSLSYLSGVPAVAYMWLTILAIVPTLVAWYAYYVLLQQIGTWASCYCFVLPPLALTLGYVFNNEWSILSVSGRVLQLTGVTLALIGTVLVMKKQISNNNNNSKATTNNNNNNNNGVTGTRTGYAKLEDSLGVMNARDISGSSDSCPSPVLLSSSSLSSSSSSSTSLSASLPSPLSSSPLSFTESSSLLKSDMSMSNKIMIKQNHNDELEKML